MTRNTLSALVLLLVLMLSPTLTYAQQVTQSAQGWLVSADDSSSLDGQFRMVTPVHPCNGTVHELPPWYAPANLTITNVQVWPGADADVQGAGLKIDAYVSLYASRPAGYLLMFHALDRYAEPNGPIDKEQPRHHRLLTGDSVGGGISCSPVAGVSHIQVIVIVSYTKDAL